MFESPMNSKAYAFLPAVLLAGLICACARPNRTSSGEIERGTPRPPPAEKVVTAEDIQRTPGAPFDQILAAKFPGVWVTRAADGGIRVRIRGTTSIEGSNEPLYVIDGIPIQTSPSGSLVGIVPADIASIEVLKDAISTTMYGLRGANGVVLIKTKQADQ